MAHPSHDAFGQQAGQGAVDRGVRLAEDARQLRRVDKRHPAEGVEQLDEASKLDIHISEKSGKMTSSKLPPSRELRL